MGLDILALPEENVSVEVEFGQPRANDGYLCLVLLPQAAANVSLKALDKHCRAQGNGQGLAKCLAQDRWPLGQAAEAARMHKEGQRRAPGTVRASQEGCGVF